MEQIGIPIPAFPALLAAGALVSSGDLSLPLCIIVAVAAALTADLTWYSIGRVRGASVLNFMCKVSWKPDTCVSKTKNIFSKYGARGLLFSKFFPGLSILASPLAGITQVPLGVFLFYDIIGATIWATAPLLVGGYLQKIYAVMMDKAEALIPLLPWLAGFLILGVLIWRYWDRNRYLRRLKESLRGGITPEELKRRLDAGEALVVVDVRDALDTQPGAVLVPGARWLPHSTMLARLEELPPDQPLILYCDCPHDETAVATVTLLKEHGLPQARPLRGGLEAWLSQGFATEKFPVAQLVP